MQLNNPHLRQLGVDALYHFALDTENNDLLAMFGDVKVKSKSCSFMYEGCIIIPRNLIEGDRVFI